MEILIVLVFVSLVLVTAAVLLFIMRIRGGDLEHADRLSLLPLEEDAASERAAAVPRAPVETTGEGDDGDGHPPSGSAHL